MTSEEDFTVMKRVELGPQMVLSIGNKKHKTSNYLH